MQYWAKIGQTSSSFIHSYILQLRDMQLQSDFLWYIPYQTHLCWTTLPSVRIQKLSSLPEKDMSYKVDKICRIRFALNRCRGFSYLGISLIKQYCMLKPFKDIFKLYSRKGLIINKSFANFRNITQYANYNDLSFEVQIF